MDPAFKQHELLSGSRVARDVPFEDDAYLSLPTEDPTSAVEFFTSRVQSHLDESSPGTTVDDLRREVRIVPAPALFGIADVPSVPGAAMPVSSVPVLENPAIPLDDPAALSAMQRYAITVSVVDDQGVSAHVTSSLPEIYGGRLTLWFPPATSGDRSLVAQYGGYFEVPAGLMNVRATISIDGRVLASGNRPVPMGATHYVVVDLVRPGGQEPDVAGGEQARRQGVQDGIHGGEKA